MPPLSTPKILEIWERGQGLHPVDRALLLLAAGFPECTRDALLTLSIGARDARLLTLREWLFGPQLRGFTQCRQCGERLEFATDVDQICVATRLEPGQSQEESVFDLAQEPIAIRFRVPNSLDLAALVACEDLESGRRLLVERCVLEATREGVPIAPSELPAELLTNLAARMAECDPQADVLFDFSCPECGMHYLQVFDVAAFFWGEISAWAKRLLREVHTLARAYGWREADILAMSAARRQSYLEMVRG